MADLFRKGIKREIIESATTKHNDETTYIESARVLAEKKLKRLKIKSNDSFKIKQKLYQFLAGRGYTSEIISKTLDSLELNSNND